MKINFASFRIAFVLIAILFILIVLTAFIPQKNISVGQVVDWHEVLGDYYQVIEFLRLDRIYSNPFFFIILGLLALNLIAGNIKRFKLIYKTDRTLIKARHIGSIIFHFSLIIIMAGVILNYLFKFEGLYALTEGQTVIDTEESYHLIQVGPAYTPVYEKFKLRLDSIDVFNDQGEAGYKSNKIFASLWLSPDVPPRPIKLATNFPYNFAEYSIHYGMVTGYSPEIIVTDTNGNNILRGFIRIAYSEVEGENRHYDFIFIEDDEIRIGLEVKSDIKAIDKPKFELDIGSHDGLIYEGIIEIGEAINFDKYKIEIPRYRNWCYITVKTHPFLNLIFFGFWFGLIGMVISFIPRLMKENK